MILQLLDMSEIVNFLPETYKMLSAVFSNML